MDTLALQQQFIDAIKSCGDQIQPLQALFSNSQGTEADKRTVLEQSFRTLLTQFIASDAMDFTPCARLVEIAISAAENGISMYTVPFYLMADMFDLFTLDICEQVFSFVENHVSTWKSKEFYTAGKILLLRMCNDLLRRLSSAQNTVFCGRIQLFLARLFPLSEKSALNLMSHFNLENITTYTKDAGVKPEGESEDQEAMEVDGDSPQEPTSAAPIDYNLYLKLWSVQDVFRLPTQVFSAEFWKAFTANVQEILSAFSSFKLEDTTQFTLSPQKQVKSRRSMSVSEYSESHYFAKFLTSEKLMNLQLQDSHFRRHVLVQLLVLFQYLVTDNKFKTSTHTLPDSGAQWVKDTSAQVYKLLEETPPNGVEFAEYIKQMLEREVSWIAWKNESCPSFEKPLLSSKENTPYFKGHLGDTIGSATIDMGSRELTRLWNLCPDNLEACKKKSRDFVPDLKSFIEEPIEQADPEAQIEAEYKLINNPNFSWRALRLLSQKSPHFFQNTTAQIKEVPAFLESVMIQTGKDFQSENSPVESN